MVAAVAVAAVLAARWVVDRTRAPSCSFVAAGTEVELTPEQAANAATIAAVAGQRQLPARAVTIALATAIQESKLRNLRYGDADSQGLFQQRPSQGWGTVAEVTDPVHASHSFYEALEQVPGWQEGVVTEVAQEVQRSAFPTAYADHEQEARTLASILTGHEGPQTSLGCRLARPTARGSADALGRKLTAQAGVTGSADVGANTLTVEAADATRAWAVAAWAVGHADAEEIDRVQVGDHVWEREDGGDGFAPLEDGAPGTVPGSTVIITVH